MTILHTDILWVLQSGDVAYALSAHSGGLVLHSYWGRRLPRLEDYPIPALSVAFPAESPLQLTPQELTTGEGSASDERGIDGMAADGSIRGLVLRFSGATVDGDTLAVTLTDAALGLRVILHYADRKSVV